MVMDVLATNALASIAAISAVIAIGSTMLQKVMIDQDEMKSIKEQSEKAKENLEKATKEGKDTKAKQHQKRMMELTQKQFKMSMKPTAVLFVLVIPLFIWLFPALYTVDPVMLENGSGTLTYRGAEAPVTLTENSDPVLTIGDQEIHGQIYGDEIRFNEQTVTLNGFELEPGTLNRNTGRLEVSRVIVTLPFGLPFFGANLGWLGWYLIVAIPVGLVSRKLLGLQ